MSKITSQTIEGFEHPREDYKCMLLECAPSDQVAVVALVGRAPDFVTTPHLNGLSLVICLIFRCASADEAEVILNIDDRRIFTWMPLTDKMADDFEERAEAAPVTLSEAVLSAVQELATYHRLQRLTPAEHRDLMREIEKILAPETTATQNN